MFLRHERGDKGLLSSTLKRFQNVLKKQTAHFILGRFPRPGFEMYFWDCSCLCSNTEEDGQTGQPI